MRRGMEFVMLKAILQSIAVIVTVGLTYVGVKWALDRLNVNPQRVYDLNRSQRTLASTRAEAETFDALIGLENAKDRHDEALEDILDARAEKKKAAKEAAKAASQKAKRAA
jgi:hypothetical protein